LKNVVLDGIGGRLPTAGLARVVDNICAALRCAGLFGLSNRLSVAMVLLVFGRSGVRSVMLCNRIPTSTFSCDSACSNSESAVVVVLVVVVLLFSDDSDGLTGLVLTRLDSAFLRSIVAAATAVVVVRGGGGAVRVLCLLIVCDFGATAFVGGAFVALAFAVVVVGIGELGAPDERVRVMNMSMSKEPGEGTRSIEWDSAEFVVLELCELTCANGSVGVRSRNFEMSKLSASTLVLRLGWFG
jgi:hypothetical protein